MAAACSGPNAQALMAEFDAEEGVGVLDRLGDATRDVLVDYGLAGLPVETAHCAQEAGHCPLVVASAVGLQGGPRILEEGVAGHREQRRLQQGQRVHDLGTVERELEDDRPLLEWPARCTRRTPRWSSRPPASAAWSAMLTGGEGVGAPGPTPPVVPDHAVAVGQRRLGEERHGCGTAGLLSNTGSPDPTTSYSSSTPLTFACPMSPPLHSLVGQPRVPTRDA